MGYGSTVIKGISWMSTLQISIRALSLIKIFILARVLTPSQFGVFGIAALILAFFELLTETGINIILIQSKKDLDKYVNSAWVVSIIRGVFISLLILFLSPFIALFFNAPEALGVLLFTSTIPFIRGFINPAIVKFQKELEFHREFWFRITLFFVDAITSILIAVIFHSVYSLVWGLLLSALLEVVLSFLVIKLRPKFIIQKEYFYEILHQGKWITMYGILGYFAENADNIVVGKVLGTASLGIYQAAYRISLLIFTEITQVINKVFFPILSKISDERHELKKIFIRSIILLSLATIPLSLVIFLFPKEIILLLLGANWLAAEQVLQILAIYGMLRAIIGYPSSFFLALQKQRYVTYTTFLRAITLGLTIVPFVYYLGLVGAAYSAIISLIVELPAVAYFLIITWKEEG